MRTVRFHALFGLFLLLGGLSFAQTTDYVVRNASLTSPILTSDWGGYNGSIAHQTIDSPGDPNKPTGSLLFTFSAASGSLTQDTGLTATGQTLTGYRVDFAHDGQCSNLILGFYESNAWDIFPGSGVNVITLGVPADTDGTLDTFTTVEIPSYTVNSSGNPILLFIGTSCTGAYGSAVAGAKFALDNVRLISTSAVQEWSLYSQ